MQLIFENCPFGNLADDYEMKPDITETFLLWRMFKHVTSAIYHIHQHGMVHRDIKPGNSLPCCALQGRSLPTAQYCQILLSRPSNLLEMFHKVILVHLVTSYQRLDIVSDQKWVYELLIALCMSWCRGGTVCVLLLDADHFCLSGYPNQPIPFPFPWQELL